MSEWQKLKILVVPGKGWEGWILPLGTVQFLAMLSMWIVMFIGNI